MMKEIQQQSIAHGAHINFKLKRITLSNNWKKDILKKKSSGDKN